MQRRNLSICSRTMIILVAAALPVLLSTAMARADEPTMSISMLDGTVVQSKVTSISSAGELSGAQLAQPIRLENVISIEAIDTTSVMPANTVQTKTRVQISGGGSVFCNSVSIEDGRLQSADVTALGSIPLEVVEAIIFRDSELTNRALANRSREKDTIVVDTPDGLKKVAGIFEGIAEGKALLNFKGKSRKIGLQKVSAIILADLSTPSPRGLMVAVRLLDQTRLNGVIASLSNGQLKLLLGKDALVAVQFNSVARIDVQTDNLAYLSDLSPIAVEEQTIFSLQRSWQRDLSIEGNPIRLNANLTDRKNASQQFAKGIGAQSYSKLVFANESDFTRFKATVGIDVETHGRGDCEMKVVSDGIVRWTKRVTATTPPIEVDIDITGMREIGLIVEPGAQFDLADHANWANARFVKTE